MDDEIDDDLRDVASAWPGLELTGRPRGGVRSDVARGRLDGQRVVVRRSSRTPEALAWQLDLVAHLDEHGVGVASVVPTSDGQRHVDGVWVEELAPGLPPEDDEAWASVAAEVERVHDLTRDWEQRPGFASAADLQRTAAGGDVDLAAMRPEVASVIRGVWRALPELPSCVVHGSLSSRTVLVHGDDVTLLDWDDARVDSPWFDLAGLPRSVWPVDGDARLVRAAGLAWETASVWRSEPAYARRRLLELRDELDVPQREPLRPEEIRADMFGAVVDDEG